MMVGQFKLKFVFYATKDELIRTLDEYTYNLPGITSALNNSKTIDVNGVMIFVILKMME